MEPKGGAGSDFRPEFVSLQWSIHLSYLVDENLSFYCYTLGWNRLPVEKILFTYFKFLLFSFKNALEQNAFCLSI